MNHNFGFEVIVGLNKPVTVTAPALNKRSLYNDSTYAFKTFAVLAFRTRLTDEASILPYTHSGWTTQCSFIFAPAFSYFRFI